MLKKSILLFLTTFFTWGCQEVIQVDLEEGKKRLVVEGRIEKIKGQNNGYQSITLSTTSDYFSNSQTPRVSGATVSVTDGSGNIFPFQESSSTKGLYETNDCLLKLAAPTPFTLNTKVNNFVGVKKYIQ
jgi:hypothetical protein